ALPSTESYKLLLLPRQYLPRQLHPQESPLRLPLFSRKYIQAPASHVGIFLPDHLARPLHQRLQRLHFLHPQHRLHVAAHDAQLQPHFVEPLPNRLGQIEQTVESFLQPFLHSFVHLSFPALRRPQVHNPARYSPSAFQLLQQPYIVFLLPGPHAERTIFFGRESPALLHHHHIHTQPRHRSPQFLPQPFLVGKNQPAAACPYVQPAQIAPQLPGRFPQWEVERIGQLRLPPLPHQLAGQRLFLARRFQPIPLPLVGIRRQRDPPPPLPRIVGFPLRRCPRHPQLRQRPRQHPLVLCLHVHAPHGRHHHRIALAPIRHPTLPHQRTQALPRPHFHHGPIIFLQQRIQTLGKARRLA